MAQPLIDAAPPAPPPGPPIAKTDNLVESQFGIEVSDPYRWMESPTNEATGELKDWLVAQGDFASRQLAATPHRDELYKRIRELGLGVAAVYDVSLGGKRVFYNTLPADAQLAKLAVREPDGSSRTLIDPEALSTPEVHVSLNAYSASPDGSLLAYVISKGGGERGELHIMDVTTGKDRPDVIERIWGEGSASWLPDGTSFFYTQLAEPKPGVDPMTGQVEKLHVMGTSVDKDPVVLGRADSTWKLADEEWPGLWQAEGSTWLIASAGGAHSEARIGVAKASELDKTGASKTPWRTVAEYTDGIVSAWPHGDRLYLLTYKDAPNRKLISVPLAKPVLANARVELAEDPAMKIEFISSAKDAMYVARQWGGKMHLDRLAWKTGAKLEPIALPDEGWIPDVASDMKRDGLVFQIETWLHTGTYYAYDPAKRKVAPIGLASTTTADTSQMIVEDVEVETAGVKVPLTIIRRKADVPGTAHPTILYAYAGYGTVERPGFSAPRVAWVERGGIWAIAHARGGGEKGRTWQDDGSRDKKMNGVHDFIACAEYLVAKGTTSPAKLAMIGVSMGGVLVGRVLTERPDLFAAVQLSAGIVNPLRTMQAENGANQKAELGDPATEAGYRSLVEMDPYTHVKGAAYPAVVFTVGLNDHRVAPWMSAKMAARLQVNTTSKKPILVRVDRDVGHGVGSTRDQTFARTADVYSFFLDQMGE